jgi:hypothetical protein
MTRYTLLIPILFVSCHDAQQKAIVPKKVEVHSDTLTHQDSGYHIDQPRASSKNADILNYLEALKWGKNSDSSGYDLNKTPKWDISLLTNNLSDNGVRFIDPNEDLNKKLSKRQIQTELSKRKGKSYEMISHMTYIYSIPYKQYSALKFKESHQEIIVDVGAWYELTFVTKNGRHYLIKCEYLQSEGE